MAVPQMLSTNGEITPDGQRLLEWVEAQFKAADETNDLSTINGLSGYLSHYYVNVHKLRTIRPEQWLQEYVHSGVTAAWRDMTFLEEQAAKEAAQDQAVEEATGATNEIAQQLAELRALVETQTKEIATQKGRITKLTKRVNEEAEEAEVEEEAPADVQEDTETAAEAADGADDVSTAEAEAQTDEA